MTPLPTRDQIAARPIFDPPRGTVHVYDMCKLANRKKDRLSHHWVGVVVWGVEDGVITKAMGDIFETDFVRGSRLPYPEDKTAPRPALLEIIVL
jgi:hypothetical protein